MPSFFFHLFFELYPPTHSFSHQLPALKNLTNRELSQLPSYLPANIFDRDLPNHKVPANTVTHVRQKSLSKLPQPSPQAVPVTLAVPPPQLPVRHPDYRFGKISMESLEMMPAEATSPRGLVPDAASAAATGMPASKARFLPLEAKNTELGYGVVHLYRDTYETPGLYSSTLKSGVQQQGGEELDEEALMTVAILAVPSYMTPSDFLGFVGEETIEAVSHFRMVRTSEVNRYMVLIKFRTKEWAAKFVKEFNGREFNSMEPENCHIVYIKSIEYVSPPSNESAAQPRPDVFPSLKSDPFSPSHSPVPLPAASVPPHLTTKPAPPPTPSLLELPTCPVCLERMDETTGLLTILCQHVFHCSCLSKWRDSTCPVCRYTYAALSTTDASDLDDIPPECSVCAADKSLWVCLICANVGCGRYDSAHAFQHYKDTAHAYAMDVETQRVWDYAGDSYVHRLIQNKADGKLVELGSSGRGREGDDEDGLRKEKAEDIGMEYTYLLTSQLDSQRTYFEQKVTQAADKAAAATAAAEKATADAAELGKQVAELMKQLKELTTETIPALTKAKDRAETKAQKAAEMARGMEKSWREEKKVAEGLLEKVKFLDEKVRKGEEEKRELEESNRDLLFHLQAREQMKGMEEEVKDGALVVGEAPEKRKKKGKGRK